MSDEEINLIAFNSIYKFVKSLGDLYSNVHKPLALYNRLISKTTISHKKVVQKHVDCFRVFCISNRDAISDKNTSKLVTHSISYSPNVYINMKEIFDFINKEDDKVQIFDAVWKHLLTISAIVDPSGRAKTILKESFKKKSPSSNKEVNFISNIIDKVEKNVDPNANPMEAISSIMSSGVINELVTTLNSDLQNGELDIGKLMNAVSGMVSSLGDNKDESGIDPMNMLQTMMGSFMGGMDKKSNSNSDNFLQNMMANLNQNNQNNNLNIEKTDINNNLSLPSSDDSLD